MRKFVAAAAAVMLMLILNGCRHRMHVVQAPPPPPPPVHHPLAIPHATLADMPAIPSPAPPTVVLGGAVAPLPARHAAHRSRAPQPKENAANSQANAVRSAAAGEEPSATTPIGQLSAAPNTQGQPGSKEIREDIQRIRQRLKNIHSGFNAKQKQTESQIETFLAKATNALQAGDLDGAHTLTVKARVLLSEIQ